MVNYDKVLESIGGFGLYQKRLCLFIFIILLPNGVHITTVIFNNYSPSFRCAVPGLSNDSYRIQNAQHEQLVKTFVPFDVDTGQFSECDVYAPLHNGSKGVGDLLANQNETRSCDKWVFDDSVFSQVVEFELVCSRAMYKAHNGLMVLLGILTGSLIGGPLSDYFGRRKTLILGLMSNCVIASAMALVNTILAVMVIRFFEVVTIVIMFLGGYVLLAETVGKEVRSKATISAMLGYTGGLFILVTIHYSIRDWRTAQLVQSLPFLTFGLFWWFVQESPRWLITKNRHKEAEDIIVYMARVNGTKWDTELDYLADGYNSKEKNSKQDYVNTELKIWHICSRSRRYTFLITVLCFSW